MHWEHYSCHTVLVKKEYQHREKSSTGKAGRGRGKKLLNKEEDKCGESRASQAQVSINITD